MGQTAPQPLTDTPHEQKLNPSGDSSTVQDTLTPESSPAMADVPHEPKLTPSGGAGVVHDNLGADDASGSGGGSYSGGASPEAGVTHSNYSPSFAGAVIPRYRSGGRASSTMGSSSVHTPKYQPSYRPQGGSQPVSSSSGSSYRPTYSAPHMPKYRPSGSASYTPKVQPQTTSGGSHPPVSSAPYTPKIPQQAPPTVHTDSSLTGPPAPHPAVPLDKPERENKTNTRSSL